MIDTDKYEGHTEGPWAWERGALNVLHVKDSEPMHTLLHDEKKDADAQLIADAPLLLAEVKRLQTIMHEIEAHNGVSAEVVAASSDALFMNDLLTEVKRLRETLATIKEDIDGYVSGKGWDGNIEGWQCISDSIAALGIESESEEE